MKPVREPDESRVSHERRVLLFAVLAGAPGGLVSLILLWTGDFSLRTQWTLSVLIVGLWLGFAFAARNHMVRPVQTLANLLAALRQGDYSIQARGARVTDALGQAIIEANALSEMLREQRLGALEATALLRTVMEEIDVAVFAFDGDARLRLINRAGERLLTRPAEALLGRTAEALGLADCLQGEPHRTLSMTFPGGAGQWDLRRSTFRQGGLPHELLVLSDLSRALREEERQAWRRLIRVLSHEINNSLAPIKSIAGSLRNLVRMDPPPADLEEDLFQGLTVIAGRAEALSRFMASYARLARLPPPDRKPMDVEPWIRRVVELETRLPVEIVPGPPVTIQADGDQLDQLLINLVRNGVDAALETGGGVRVGWSVVRGHLEVWVRDDGPGLADTANLFVPFFTTKRDGTGIGLVLSRQIAEGHGGTLTLVNRSDGPGCEARLRIPLGAAVTLS